MIPRLQKKYQEEIRTKLRGLDKYGNIHQVPKIDKIVVHMGVSPELGKEVLGDALKDMTIFTGRKPTLNKAKGSVANFKLRQGMTTGCRVTLRRQTMYEFLDRLIATALPRVRELAEKRFGDPGFGLREAGLVGTASAVVDRLGELIELGCGQLVLFTHDRCSEQTLELLSTEVIPQLPQV